MIVASNRYNNNGMKVVDLAKSSVDMMGTKVEVKLKKADPMRWAGLHFKEK